MSAGVIVIAHVGTPLRPHDVWTAWSFEPVTILLLAASAALYTRGLARLWHAAGTGRGVRQRDACAFGVGWTLLALALLSPLHALGGVLFAAHMTQHEVLMTVAAPLLVLGRPLVPFVWALSPRWRRITGEWGRANVVARPWRAITHPASAFLLHGAAIWMWHVPSLYDATVHHEAMHAAQHLSFILTALLFWWVVLQPTATRGGAAASIAVLFGTVLHTGALGAVLTLTSRLFYSAYAATTGPWGFQPIADQQLGGLIMWVPGGLAYVVAALSLFVRMLRDSEERVRDRETREATSITSEPGNHAAAGGRR